MLASRTTSLLIVASSLSLAAIVAACSPDSDTIPDDGDTTGSGATKAATGTGAQTTAAATTAATTVATVASSATGGCQGLGDACTNCTFAQCEQQYCDCGENPACNELASCTDACAGNAQCAQACATQNQAGVSDAIILSECAATQCGSQCPTVARPDACQVCAAQNCAAQLNACVADPECLPLIQCAQECNGDNFCLIGCANDYGGGQDEAEALGGCVDPTCNAQCQ